MVEALEAVFPKGSAARRQDASPEATLKRWGGAVKAAFHLANLPLLNRDKDTGAMQTTAAMQALGLRLGALQEDVSALRTDSLAICQEVHALKQNEATFLQAVGAASAMGSPPGSAPRGSAFTSPLAGVAARLCSPLGGTGSVSAADLLSTIDSTIDAAAEGSSMGPLVPPHGHEEVRPAALSMDDKTAAQFYREMMAKGGTVPFTGGDKSRAKLVRNFFNAFASEEEKVALKPPAACAASSVAPTAGERRRIELALHRVATGWLIEQCRAKEIKLKGGLLEGRLPCSAVEDRLRKLKKKGLLINLDPMEVAGIPSLRDWRKAAAAAAPAAAERAPASAAAAAAEASPGVPTAAEAAATAAASSSSASFSSFFFFLSSRSRRWRVLRESLRPFLARLAALAATAAEGFAFGMLVEERV